jgi:DNA polymerase-3 subunit alpha
MSERFCHLHLHTEYSLLDGVIRIPQVAETCRRHKMDAVAITDHGVMYGAIEHLTACRNVGIKPIIGCEMYTAPESRHDRNSDNKGRNGHLLLLVLDEKGYRNLSTLVSLSYREGFYYKPRIDRELISRYSDGLVALSGCLRGEINQRLLLDDIKGAREIAGFYKDVFGPDRFFIEIQDHGLADQERVNPKLVDIARESGLHLVATNDCHFLTPKDREIQDVMICIQTGKKLADINRFHAYTPDHYFKPPEEMANLFRWVPEAISNTARIADMVSFDPPLDAFHFPKFNPPDGSSPEDYLRVKAREGLARILGGRTPENYSKQLEYELDVICDMGFASYILIVADFVGWAKNRGIPVGPGRGSAASCLVSYALGITGIDPIEYGLVFERFLNPARKSMPDIDIDFEPHGRADVIDYVTRTYGEEHVCQIITFNRLKARAAIRDVARVMDIPLSEADKMAKLVPWGASLEESIQRNPEFAQAYEASELTKKWIETAKAVEGLTRNAGIHAAGVVICADPIQEHAPVQIMEGENAAVCQYSMDWAEKVGLVKMDFLGLRTLTYIQDAIDNIRTVRGEDLDIRKIPLDDPATFRMLGAGDVLGVFQMEGGGMRELLMEIAPDRLEDLIATIALFRPGPMENNLHHSYARRKNGREPITVRHPLQKPILGPTYGVLTYQEQISLMLQALGGIDLATSTFVMKLISKKKDRTTIAKYKEDFLKGAEERGVDRGTARDIWNEMEGFAGYGFNKAHSAAYGLISYETAYLKANYPKEFHAAYMTSEMSDPDKIGWIVDEVKNKGIPVYPPDINTSRARFAVEGDGIRYGLAAIKGVGILAVESMVSEREENGPYTNIFELTSRIDLRLVNKGVIEALVTSGAFDSLKGTRHGMMEALPDALEFGKRQQEDRVRGQVALFGLSSDTGSRPGTPDLEEFPRREMLRMEKESLGFYLSHHPLEDVWSEMKPRIRENIADLADMRDGRSVRVGGMIGWVSKRLSKRMQNFALFNLEDMSGKVDGIIFPQAYEQFGNLIEADAFVLMKGRLRVDEKESKEQTFDDQGKVMKEIQLVAEAVWKYDQDGESEESRWISSTGTIPDTVIEEDIVLEDDALQRQYHGRETAAAEVNIVLDIDLLKPEDIAHIKHQLSEKKGPTPVKLRFSFGDKEAVIAAGREGQIIYSPELRETLLRIPAVKDVVLETGRPRQRA